jgi:hypothetical protein
MVVNFNSLFQLPFEEVIFLEKDLSALQTNMVLSQGRVLSKRRFVDSVVLDVSTAFSYSGEKQAARFTNIRCTTGAFNLVDSRVEQSILGVFEQGDRISNPGSGFEGNSKALFGQNFGNLLGNTIHKRKGGNRGRRGHRGFGFGAGRIEGLS